VLEQVPQILIGRDPEKKERREKRAASWKSVR
jgi:hypothetical protein